jgi:hypothetical protein
MRVFQNGARHTLIGHDTATRLSVSLMTGSTEQIHPRGTKAGRADS